MAVSLHIRGLPPEIWLNIFSNFDIKMLGVIARVCCQFQQMSNNEVLWELQARKMLKLIPTPPAEGWKAWVTQPSPVKFDVGIIDLTKREIFVYQGVDAASMLDYIPGKLTCSFTKPMDDGYVGVKCVDVWYRKEGQPLIKYSDCFCDDPAPEAYVVQFCESDNRNFKASLSPIAK